MLAEFALQSGHLSEGNVVREEIQQAVVLNPVLLRVTIQVRDLVDRLRVTDKRERRNQCTRAHPGHCVELGLGEWGSAGTFCHPLRNPAPNAPRSPPPEMMRMSTTGGCFCPPALYRSYSAFVRSSSRPNSLRPSVMCHSSLALRCCRSSCCEMCSGVREWR